jgi:hypothetical protein
VWEEEVAELQREGGEVLRREEREKAGHGAGSWLGKERERKGRRCKKEATPSVKNYPAFWV